MATQWSEGILLSHLSDEPELSEDLSALFDQLKQSSNDKLPSVVLNFESVSYLNSSQIAALLRLRKRLAEGRRQLVLASLREELWSVLLLTGLDKVFQVAPDTMTALARVQLEDSGGAAGA